jgi:hypothetical protein
MPVNFIIVNQFQIYDETRERCRRIFGDVHHLMCRLAFNTGIVYEDAKDLEAAYPYFRQAYEVAMQVFGPEHYFTEKYKKTLAEKNYTRIAKKKGHTLN